MIQESLLKTNFLGRDGFRWWIGQIPQESSHGGQINGAGWGNRFKVRIMGYHPYDLTELPDEDLPWAQCLLPTTAGTGAANHVTTVKVSPGDVVFGFFLDTDNAHSLCKQHIISHDRLRLILKWIGIYISRNILFHCTNIEYLS